MKKTTLPLLLVTLVFSISHSLRSQNFVVNPDFENYSACPNATCQISNATGWYNASGNASYFNSCGSNGYGVPDNKYGYQQPASGNGYAEFSLFNGYATQIDNIGEELTAPLIVGQKYFVSFKISLSGKSSAASDRMGIGFSTVPDYAICGSYSWWESFVKFYSDLIITDTLNWTTISGSFISDSAYKFITIGYMNVDTIHFINLNSTSMPFALYYLDDVCVSEDSLTCLTTSIFENNFKKKVVTVFPDPATNFITIETAGIEGSLQYEIFDLIGKQVSKGVLKNSKENVINISNLQEGLYLLNVWDGKERYCRKFIKE